MADFDAFPLTCGWCNAGPATHLLIVDYRPKGKQAATRQESRLCAGCAGHTTVLSSEFVGYWLYKLVPALPGDEPAEPGLGERVTASLLEAGFRQHQPGTDAKLAAFSVNEADGDRVTVSVIWAANDEWRGKVLAKLGEALRADGFTTRPAGGCLYVDPKRAGQDPATTGTEAGGHD